MKINESVRVFVYSVLGMLVTAAVAITIVLAILHASNQDRTNRAQFTHDCIIAGKQIVAGNCIAAAP